MLLGCAAALAGAALLVLPGPTRATRLRRLPEAPGWQAVLGIRPLRGPGARSAADLAATTGAGRLSPARGQSPPAAGPLLLDLVEVCLDVGLPPASALEVAATALATSGLGEVDVAPLVRSAQAGTLEDWGRPGPHAASRGRTTSRFPGASRADQAATGTRPGAGGAADEVLATLGRAFALAELTGAPTATVVSAAATRLRAERHAAARIAAARLGSHLVLPLGLAVLPAFVLLGVVPVVLALATRVATG